jgi:hypothetical protein
MKIRNDDIYNYREGNHKDIAPDVLQFLKDQDKKAPKVSSPTVQAIKEEIALSEDK